MLNESLYILSIIYKFHIRIGLDIFEGIDVDNTDASKECDIYHYFLSKGFILQPNACNRCHDLLMLSMNLSDISILNIKGFNYYCIISRIRKYEAINLRQHEISVWPKKGENHKN